MTERSAREGAPVSERVDICAPAKVNLILKVLDRRPDGYHNLWSLMQTVGVEDRLRFRLRPDSTAIRLTCDDPSLPTDTRNLIVRAASLLKDRARRSEGLDIEVEKRIPQGAGLGGGSSNAAATIIGLNRLLRLGWAPEELAKVGLAVGSDVPFFFSAPSAVVRGRGEDVTAVRVAGERWVVLVRPDFPVETKWAYERLAGVRAQVPPLSDALTRLSATGTISWDQAIPLMENDFEAALAATHGVFREIKEELLAHGADNALLSGSGSTVFGVFRTAQDAARAREAIGGARGYWAVAAETSPDSLTCRESI